MEASAVATPTSAAPPAEPEETHDGAAEATRSTEELFQWSGYVHVGRGAEDCEHGLDGECVDPEHFHAWVCLPNSFQIRDIGDKAKAAKARKIRSLKDPDSDSYVTLEDELDSFRVGARFDHLVTALAKARVDAHLPDIMRAASEDERFENHAQDAEELQRLELLPEDERDPEEYERLQKDMVAFAEEIERGINERVETEEKALRALPVDDVIAEQRQLRIEDIGNEAYLHTYYTWAMYVGARQPTMTGFSSARKFAKPDDLREAAPEIIYALRSKIQQLETRTTARGDAAGNS
jgi:hypothetical protein